MIELTSPSIQNIAKGLRGFLNGPQFRELPAAEIGRRALSFANIYRDHRETIREMFNTNALDAELQRQVILQDMLEEFVIPLKPLQDFSARFNSVPLEGTDKIEVPYFPLQAAGSNSWDPATGYATTADTNQQHREVRVGGSGTLSGANAPAGTACDRRYIGMQFSSYELRRQPYLNLQKLAIQNANKLAVDIFTDIVSRVICAANFAGQINPQPPEAWTSDTIADLYGQCTAKNWPVRDRSLTIDHTINTALIKDATYKQYLSAGTTETLRQAMITNAYGFDDISVVPNLANYSPAGEHLIGWICWRYGVLVATSPIMPTEEVRALMTRYELAVHPDLGLALEYRRFGNSTMDTSTEIVECSYGAAKGVDTALIRLASQ
jgi:hypothetical protein